MRIFLADNVHGQRLELKWMLEQDPELNVVGEADDMQHLLTQVQATHPDLVLLNWELPGVQRTDLLSALRCLGCPLRIVAYSKRKETRQEVVAAGPDAFVCQEEPVEQLLKTVRAVCWLSPCIV